jgi:hypothetical protein
LFGLREFKAPAIGDDLTSRSIRASAIGATFDDHSLIAI